MVHGRRRAQLQKAFTKALESAVSGVGNDALKYFPPDLSEVDKRTIQAYWDSMIQNVLSNIQSEFEVICDERQLTLKLNALDELIEQQPVLSDGTRLVPEFFQLAAETVFRERIIARKTREKQRLMEQLAQVEADNTQLKSRLDPQREEVQGILKSLDARETLINQAMQAAVLPDSTSSAPI